MTRAEDNQRLLAAADLELRTRLADYDDHDDVLDTRRGRNPAAERRSVRSAQDRFATTGQAK